MSVSIDCRNLCALSNLAKVNRHLVYLGKTEIELVPATIINLQGNIQELLIHRDKALLVVSDIQKLNGFCVLFTLWVRECTTGN